jgi:hypothetical protein
MFLPPKKILNEKIAKIHHKQNQRDEVVCASKECSRVYYIHKGGIGFSVPIFVYLFLSKLI